MKNLLFPIIFLIIISCKGEGKSIPILHQGVFIEGNVNLADGTEIHLQIKSFDKSFKTIQTTKVNEQLFSFSENIMEPKLYYIGFDYTDKKIPFIANKYNTLISMDTDIVGDAKVVGVSILHDYYAFNNDLEDATNKFVFKLNYIEKNSNSILSAIILKEMLGRTAWRLGQNKKGYDFLSPDIQNTLIGKEINTFLEENASLLNTETIIAEVDLDPDVPNPEFVAAEEITEIVKENENTEEIKNFPKIDRNYNLKTVPNFYAESLDGTDISLDGVIGNNTIVLVDFWASWCGPCRFQNPHLIKLYNKYHSVGFTIVGVSEDKYRDTDKWKAAIHKDGLPWKQVIDDNKRVAKMFGVTALPHAFLLDKDRGIILQKETTFVIEEKLKEIYGF